MAAESKSHPACSCIRQSHFSTVDGAGPVPVSRRPNVMMPDEYLPPNKILFLQNLPETVTKDQLMGLFSQCVTIYFLREVELNLPLSQIPQPVRSSSHSDEEGYRLRGVCRRRKCDCRKGRVAQLQAGWGEQDQGAPFPESVNHSLFTFLCCRSHSRGSEHFCLSATSHMLLLSPGYSANARTLLYCIVAVFLRIRAMYHTSS